MRYKKKYDSPIGALFLGSDGKYLTDLHFEASLSFDPSLAEGMEEDLPIFKEAIQWLDLYFKGQDPGPIPAYRIENMTPFQECVIEEMKKIPFGETTTYSEIAASIARKRKIPRMSAQAVGGAVGWNPICILIPCHRVIGTNGNLTGYSGGIENKIALLAVEGHDTKKYPLPKERKK